MPGVGYLGPRGTFSEEALVTAFPGVFDPVVPFTSVPDVLTAVESGDVDKGMVPIENSIEGSVNVTLDTLAFETSLLIEREVIHPIRHHLLARAGLSRERVERIVSLPHATAQCKRFLARVFPGVPLAAANSTAEAAQIVAESTEPLAAVAARISADIYGLAVLEQNIEDYQSNQTRFVLVGRESPEPTGDDKTSLVCFIKANRPGSLLEILQEFAGRGINLSKIESRPTKKALGEYYFFMDIQGHTADPEVSGAIGLLSGKLRELRILGSYPAASAPEA